MRNPWEIHGHFTSVKRVSKKSLIEKVDEMYVIMLEAEISGSQYLEAGDTSSAQ